MTEIRFINVKRPEVIESMFKGFGSIDYHDHLRQGSLRLHKAWKTHTWWHRLFGNIECIIATDAFFAYIYEYKNNNFGSDEGSMEFIDFMDKLSYQLIHNKFDDIALRNTGRRGVAIVTPQRPEVNKNSMH